MKMESWIPLLEILSKSQSPETEACEWLQQESTKSTIISTSSFLSLLTKPCNVLSSQPTRVIMYIQTLPSMVQSRILSFLMYESKRFCARDLSKLAKAVLNGADFWVKKSACNLLDVLSDSNYDSGLNLDSAELPHWIKDRIGNSVFPWLPLSGSIEICNKEEEEEEEDFDGRGENFVEEEVVVEMKIDSPEKVCFDRSEVERMAVSLRARVVSFESKFDVVSLANEILEFCFNGSGDSFALLGMIEAWKADDETVAVLISHLSKGSENRVRWLSHVLSSVILPKLLVLQVPASRVLLTAVLEFCKLNQTATVDALIFPLVLRKEGINNAICDVITKILKECLHPGHVSAFCHKLLCREQDERKIVCLPCHKHLISEELVWNESLFNLFQNILNHNVHLTQDSVDSIVYQVQVLAEGFSSSLKFGNFLLCLVMKCHLLLRSQKFALVKAVEQTNTLVTKSLLSKLDDL